MEHLELYKLSAQRVQTNSVSSANEAVIETGLLLILANVHDRYHRRCPSSRGKIQISKNPKRSLTDLHVSYTFWCSQACITVMVQW